MSAEQILQTIINLSPAAQIASLTVVVLAILQLLTVAYNALARRQITHHTRGLRTLNQAMALANQSFALKAASGGPLEILLEHTQVRVGAIHLLDPDRRQLELVCARGVNGSSENCLDRLPKDTVIGQAIQTGSPVRLAGPADKDYLRALAQGKSRVCMISVPIAGTAKGAACIPFGLFQYILRANANFLCLDDPKQLTMNKERIISRSVRGWKFFDSVTMKI